MIDRQQWQETFEGALRGEVNFGALMKEKTSLGIGGPCDVHVAVDEPVSLRNLIVGLKRMGLPYTTIGGGTNLLVRDGGIEGVAVSLKGMDRVEVLKEDDLGAELFVEAGVPLQRLVALCKARGYAGLEGLAGIPGTVGGAICGNAGSYGAEMKDVVVSVAVMDSGARLDRYAAGALGFGYRSSGLRATDIVLSANLRVRRDDPRQVALRTEMNLSEKKKTQPLAERSAGCVFKNPAGGSAGRLMEEAGCKGMRAGGIEVSGVHANFFINTGGGTAGDFMRLMEETNAAVRKRFGTVLEPEIRIVGRA